MKKFLSMVTAAVVLVSTAAYANASEPLVELANTSDAAAYSADSTDQAKLLSYTELEDGTLEVNCPEENSKKLKELIIPAVHDGKKVTSIGSFWDCPNLTTVKIPSSITYIGMDGGGFGWCPNIKTFEIEERESTPGTYASFIIDTWSFTHCEIQSITLPRRVYIYERAFEGDNKISNVYYGGTKAEWAAVGARADWGNEPLFNAKIHCAMQDEQYPVGESSVVTTHTEYSGSNIGYNNYYGNFARRVGSYLTETSDGFMRVQFNAVDEKILVEYYTDKFEFKSSKLIDYELPLFGGFYETEENYYVLSGQTNYNEDNSVEVCRVTKYDKNWKHLGAATLLGNNTTIPFDAGSARMAHKDNRLVVRTSHEMYASGDGLNHQANLTFIIDTDKMVVTDCISAISNIGVGYCSHSFNQFIEVDGNNIVAVDHGDGSPRCVVLCRYTADIASGRLINGSNCESLSMFPISGKKGNNYTGVEVGGFEVTDSSYIVAGTSVNQENQGLVKNVFVSAVNSEREINFITDYTEDGVLCAANPQLVKINDDKLILMWQLKAVMPSSIFTSSDDKIPLVENTVYYTFLDGTGKQIGEIKQISGNLSDCKPIVHDDQIIWYTWNGNTVDFNSIYYSNVPVGTSFIENNLKYTVLNDGTLEVSCPDENKESLTAAVIPSFIRRMKVTSIGEKAFHECKNLVSVKIPDSITTIKKYGFTECFALKAITLPESVNYIGEGAFADCTTITSVTIPGSIASIDNYAFYRCDNLESVVIMNGVTNIGNNAFSYNPKLSSVKIPDSVKNIDYSAFEWCAALTSIVIPDGIESIGNQAFYACDGLTSLTIPKSVTKIAGSAFQSCKNLTEFNVDVNNPNYCSLNGVLFNKDKSELILYPLGNKRTHYKIPNGVEIVDDNSFNNCTNLTSVVIPEGVTIIGQWAFCGSENIVSIVIPQSIKDIYQSAFGACTSLKDVYYPGTEEQWSNVRIAYSNNPLKNANIHYECSGLIGTPVDITINAPERVDTSGQIVNVTGSGVNTTLTITDYLLDVSSLTKGTYTFTFSANNCAPRAYDVTVSSGAVSGLDEGVELHLYGDINGDGKVNIVDVARANAHAKNTKKLEGYDFSVCDVSGDGNVNIVDVARMNAHVKNTKSLW